ncbi:MAG: HAD family hydrolase [Clostridia bacterium]|nr:HAD family hydrolase [Clostridia bacterium]
MKFKNYLFDLDGTLTDPETGIKNSILYALVKCGLPPLTGDTLNAFIGPPLLDSFQIYCGVSPENAKILLQYYREYFKEKGMFENTVYPGIKETLQALKKRGSRLYIATSKPEPFAKQILEHFNLMEYFSFVGGSTLDETRTKKEEVIQYVLKECDLNPADCLMVGDRYYDIEGARSCGIMVAAVLFGYGDADELKTADYLIDEAKNLLII